MSTLSEFWRKQRARWYARSVPHHHQLRRRLAYYVARHGFEIGDFSLGNPIVRLYDERSRLKVGRYSSLAAGVTLLLGGQHRTDTVTTFPLGLASRRLRPADLAYSRGDIVIGSDVWIAANATILSGTTIGDGAVVGAGAVIISDVPPYGAAFGNPARGMSQRFSDEIVAVLLELRGWDLTAEHVQALGPLLQSKDVEGLIAECRKLRAL